MNDRLEMLEQLQAFRGNTYGLGEVRVLVIRPLELSDHGQSFLLDFPPERLRLLGGNFAAQAKFAEPGELLGEHQTGTLRPCSSLDLLDKESERQLRVGQRPRLGQALHGGAPAIKRRAQAGVIQ